MWVAHGDILCWDTTGQAPVPPPSSVIDWGLSGKTVALAKHCSWKLSSDYSPYSEWKRIFFLERRTEQRAFVAALLCFIYFLMKVQSKTVSYCFNSSSCAFS